MYNISMKIEYDNVFDCPHDSKVFQIFPDVHGDNRGYFTEVLKANQACNVPSWMIDNSWIKQINRSSSKGGTVRGFHA